MFTYLRERIRFEQPKKIFLFQKTVEKIKFRALFSFFLKIKISVSPKTFFFKNLKPVSDELACILAQNRRFRRFGTKRKFALLIKGFLGKGAGGGVQTGDRILETTTRNLDVYEKRATRKENTGLGGRARQESRRHDCLNSKLNFRPSKNGLLGERKGRNKK